jgi:c-di-GMP-binding flagellar brake protein YcgR
MTDVATNQFEKHMTDEAPLSLERSDQPTHPADRRDAERHPCTLQPSWHIAGAGLDDATRAAIRDISATGIGFLIQQPVKAGTVLILKLQTQDQRFCRPLPARVMHTTLQTEGDWLIGCRFVRALSAQELRVLLGDD